MIFLECIPEPCKSVHHYETGCVFMNPEPWVNLEAVAEHLAVSTDTVRRWIREREMPAHKVGGMWRFKVSEVDSWVREGKKEGER